MTMLSQTNLSPLVFSPRPRIVAGSFGLTRLPGKGTVTQDEFSYVVSTDGIEVYHPQASSDELPFDQHIAHEKDDFLLSESAGAVAEKLAYDFNRLSLSTDVQDTSNNSVAVAKAPLCARRGKCLAILDLDEDSRPSNEHPWPSSKGEGSPHGGRPKGFPPISDEYEIIREIGDDAEGVCTLVKRRTDAQLRVIKSVKYPELLHNKPIEARILQDILPSQHENIIQLYSYSYSPQDELVQYDLEYCTGGDLSNLISRYNNHNAYIPEPFIWKTFHALISALSNLHLGFSQHTNNGIVHRDIKPENIFLRRSSKHPLEYPDIVLADFGLATTDFATHEPAGTFCWQPPEIPRKAPKGDVWAVGAIVHYMVHMTTPILPFPRHIPPTDRNLELWDLRPASRRPIRSVPKEYSPDLIGMMLLALEMEECRRMNSGRLLGVLEEVMGRECEPGMEKFMQAEALAEWAFGGDEDGERRGGGRGRGKGSGGDEGGYGQYCRMMEEFYPGWY